MTKKETSMLMGKFNHRYRQHYDKQLKCFEDEFTHLFRYHFFPWQKSYIERANKYVLHRDCKNKKFLDIATGSGYMAIEMAKKGLNIIACDLSPASINRLTKIKKEMNLKNLKLMRCYADEIPLASNSVDYITAIAILEHIPNEIKAVKEWKRLLKKGGRLYITVPLKFRYVIPLFWPINYFHDRRIGHLRRYDLTDLQRKFKIPVKKVFYTGHFLKVVGILFEMIFRIASLEELLERWDNRHENIAYGASNISVVFEK